MVDSLDVAKATEVPIGGYGIFPKADLSEIYIKSWLLKKVLCHEITHAAMFSYNVNLSLEQEELLADLIATYGEEILIITNKIFAKLKRG